MKIPSLKLALRDSGQCGSDTKENLTSSRQLQQVQMTKQTKITHNHRLDRGNSVEGQQSEVDQIAILCHFPARERAFSRILHRSLPSNDDAIENILFRQHQSLTEYPSSVRVLCSL
jgi:hypothetical protein